MKLRALCHVLVKMMLCQHFFWEIFSGRGKVTCIPWDCLDMEPMRFEGFLNPRQIST